MTRSNNSDNGSFDYESIFEPEPETSWRSNVPRQKLLKRLGIAAGVLVVVLMFSNWIMHQFDPSGAPKQEVNVEIPKGTSLSQVGSLLEKRNVIPSALAFRLWLKFDEGVPNLQAGEYTFHTNQSVTEALQVLRAGPETTTNVLVIPEGFRVQQIAERVGKIRGFSTEKFLEVAKSGVVRSVYQPSGSNNLEGLLFPDTYTIGASDTEQTLLERMVKGFEAQAQRAGLPESNARIGHSPYEALIIASLIESEAKTEGDRGKISQVIENRLQKNMPLQIDAAVLYALGNTKQVLTNSDLRVSSPYNTYTNNGLPPAPISNPGRASLLAALQPTPGPWIYYVVADEKGNHAFATTSDEHNRNVQTAREKGLCCQ